MSFTTRTEFGIAKVFINGDQIVASFANNHAGKVAFEVFKAGLAQSNHSLQNDTTGEFLVGTLEMLDHMTAGGPFPISVDAPTTGSFGQPI